MTEPFAAFMWSELPADASPAKRLEASRIISPCTSQVSGASNTEPSVTDILQLLPFRAPLNRLDEDITSVLSPVLVTGMSATEPSVSDKAQWCAFSEPLARLDAETSTRQMPDASMRVSAREPSVTDILQLLPFRAPSNRLHPDTCTRMSSPVRMSAAILLPSEDRTVTGPGPFPSGTSQRMVPILSASSVRSAAEAGMTARTVQSVIERASMRIVSRLPSERVTMRSITLSSAVMTSRCGNDGFDAVGDVQDFVRADSPQVSGDQAFAAFYPAGFGGMDDGSGVVAGGDCVRGGRASVCEEQCCGQRKNRFHGVRRCLVRFSG